MPFSRGFPTQGSDPLLRHCRQILYHLSYPGRPWRVDGTFTKHQVTSSYGVIVGVGRGGEKGRKKCLWEFRFWVFFFFFVEFLVGRVKGKFNREGT